MGRRHRNAHAARKPVDKDIEKAPETQAEDPRQSIGNDKIDLLHCLPLRSLFTPRAPSRPSRRTVRIPLRSGSFHRDRSALRKVQAHTVQRPVTSNDVDPKVWTKFY